MLLALVVRLPTNLHLSRLFVNGGLTRHNYVIDFAQLICFVSLLMQMPLWHLRALTFFSSIMRTVPLRKGLVSKNFWCNILCLLHFAPATFAHLHDGPSPTWTHPTGIRSRLDFVLVSSSFFEFASKSYVWTDYDGTFAHEDHLPACLHLDGWLLGTPDSLDPRWDAEALLDPARCAAFQQALQTLPVPSWDVSVDSHCQIYEHQYCCSWHSNSSLVDLAVDVGPR